MDSSTHCLFPSVHPQSSCNVNRAYDLYSPGDLFRSSVLSISVCFCKDFGQVRMDVLCINLHSSSDYFVHLSICKVFFNRPYKMC